MSDATHPKKAGDPCPSGHPVVRKPRMFAWRGVYCHGLVCETCNALYVDPEDDFFAVVAANASREEGTP